MDLYGTFLDLHHLMDEYGQKEDPLPRQSLPGLPIQNEQALTGSDTCR